MERALSALKEFVIAEYNGKALFYAIVNWDAVETGQTVFNLSGYTLNYGNDISQNLFLVANMLKRQNLTMPLSPSEGWPLRMNSRIQCTHNTTLLNDEENMVFGTAPVFNHFAPGKENIVIKDKPLGRFCVYETTNTQYENYNIVHQKAYNPYYEEIVHRDVTVYQNTDKRIYLKGFVTSAKDVIVYKNGIRLAKNMYKVYPYHNLIVLDEDYVYDSNDLFTCDYVTKQEHFILTPTFKGLNFVPNTVQGNRIQYDLDGIDKGTYINNNYRLSRHGFRPMSFVLEGFASDHYENVATDRVNLDGYIIELANDPSGTSSEKVLRLKHGTVNTSNASDNPQRIEGNVSRHIKANKIINEVELYIPSTIKGENFNANAINWFVIQEYWSGRTTGEKERRITLSLHKECGDENLSFSLSLKDVDLQTNIQTENQLNNDNLSCRFEFDKWIYMCIEIEPGDDFSGRIRISIKPENEEVYTFEKIIRTVYPASLDDTQRPIYEDFCVMKLYTSANYVSNKTFSSECEGNVSNVQIFFRNCKIDCICAIDDHESNQ